MKTFWLILLLALLLLFACSPVTTPSPAATATLPQPEVAPPQATLAPTTAPTTALPAATLAPVETTAPPSFPLAEPGPYFAGNMKYTYTDSTRAEREIEVLVWYPSLEQKNADGKHIPRDAPPDMSGAPYPLILTEGSSGSTLFQSHLASHGFVMAQIQIPDHDDYFNWDVQLLDWPRDFLFILDQIATKSPEGLEGVIDSEHVGATGYSYGGDITLTLSGVRIDPQEYLAYCEQPPAIEAEYGAPGWYLENICGIAAMWDEFTAFAGDAITTSQDGLWQPLTDERIRAVMPMAPSGTWLYGERGLASADRPVLVISPTEDEITPYKYETVFLFEHLGAPMKSLISFIGKGHMMVAEAEQIAQMKHFAAAFFGYHLQGRQDYAVYFSEEFVQQFDDLAWGVYSGE